MLFAKARGRLGEGAAARVAGGVWHGCMRCCCLLLAWKWDGGRCESMYQATTVKSGKAALLYIYQPTQVTHPVLFKAHTHLVVPSMKATSFQFTRCARLGKSSDCSCSPSVLRHRDKQRALRREKREKRHRWAVKGEVESCKNTQIYHEMHTSVPEKALYTHMLLLLAK
jgi:hypothetical protein